MQGRGKLTQDIYVQAAGRLWCRSASIATGRPSNTQGADLHYAWQAKKKCSFLRRFGTLRFFETHHPLWDTLPRQYKPWRHAQTSRSNCVSIAQFRASILTVAIRPTYKSETAHVCSALPQAWGLPVICPCIIPPQPRSTQGCMTTSTTAVGINITYKGSKAVTKHAQRNGFINPCSL